MFGSKKSGRWIMEDFKCQAKGYEFYSLAMENLLNKISVKIGALEKGQLEFHIYLCTSSTWALAVTAWLVTLDCRLWQPIFLLIKEFLSTTVCVGKESFCAWYKSGTKIRIFWLSDQFVHFTSISEPLFRFSKYGHCFRKNGHPQA